MQDPPAPEERTSSWCLSMVGSREDQKDAELSVAERHSDQEAKLKFVFQRIAVKNN